MAAILRGGAMVDRLQGGAMAAILRGGAMVDLVQRELWLTFYAESHG